jgi:hypothetical protein
MFIKRQGVTISLILTASLFYSHVAVADTKLGVTDNSILKSEFDKYKEELLAYRQNLKAYEEQRKAINAAFKSAIERALSDSKELENSILTQVQKRQQFAFKKGSIAMAISIRDSAMAALGEVPTPPIEPIKPVSNSKSRKVSKPLR